MCVCVCVCVCVWQAGTKGDALHDDNDIKATQLWMNAQMKIKPTSHRAHARARSNPRITG